MKHTHWFVVGYLILLCSGFSWAADAMPVKCSRPLSAVADIQKYITMDGELDFAALQADGIDLPLLPSDFYLLRHALAGESESEDLSIPAVYSDPDDMYWRHDIPAFYPGTNGGVFAIASYQGSLIVAGKFTVAGGRPARNIAAWDGHDWTTLGAGMNWWVNALAVYDGKLIVGGRFDSAGGVPISYLAAWDGTTWTSFGAGVNDQVASLGLYDGDLIVGGWFDSIGGVAARHIARWDGTSWSTLGPGTNGTPVVFATYHGELITGGYFDTAGSVRAVGIASWDDSTWSPLGPELGPDNPQGWWAVVSVNALVEYEDKLIVGGTLSGAEGVTSKGAIAWDGENWSAMDAGIGWVDALEVYDSVLYMSQGNWSLCDCISAMKRWNGSEWITLDIEPSCDVQAFQIYEGSLYAGGWFSRVGSVRSGGIAAWDGTDWSALGKGITAPVAALGIYGNHLIAGGFFESTSESVAKRIAAWDGTTWTEMDIGIPPIPIPCDCVGWCPCDCSYLTKYVSPARAFTEYDGQLIVGGHFLEAGNMEVRSIAAWDGSVWSSVGSGFNPDEYDPGVVSALARFQDHLIAAGSFSGAGDVEVRNIAAWDGTSWAPLGNGLNNPVSALAIYDGKLIAAGSFDSAGSVAAPGIAVWDGTTWSAFAPGTDEPIARLAVYHGLLIATGRFASAGGIPASHIAAWNGSDWNALGSGIDGDVWAMSVFDGQLFVGGLFNSAGGVAVNNIASWDGSSWFTLGSGTSALVHTLAVYKHRLVVGGDFQSAGDTWSPYLAEWTKRGQLEVAVNVKPGACPNAINGNSAHGRGKAVLPVAILGTAELDVHEIDPASVMLNGVSAVRWSYDDVGTPGEDTDDDCACSEAGPDGFDDLTLKFYSVDIVATLESSPSVAPAGHTDRERYVVEVEGALTDGLEFTGSECVVLVGRNASKQASEAPAVRGFELIGNYPNPFNPSTRISFYLPEAGHVRLDVINILGQRVITLLDARMEPGTRSVTWNAGEAASGVYYYRLQTGGDIVVGRMLLVR